MSERHEFEHLRRAVGLIDWVAETAFTGLGLFVMLWVLVVFPAAIIYWTWPWISAAMEWLRELLTFA